MEKETEKIIIEKTKLYDQELQKLVVNVKRLIEEYRAFIMLILQFDESIEKIAKLEGVNVGNLTPRQLNPNIAVSGANTHMAMPKLDNNAPVVQHSSSPKRLDGEHGINFENLSNNR